MSVATTQLMTAAEFEALPEDGIERDLICGELRERSMTRRNKVHARIESRIAQLIGNWLDANSDLKLETYSGEVGCVLRRDPDSTVGVDVAVASLEQERLADEAGTTMIEGPPLLAVEVLSPNDTVKDITEKVTEYLNTGVALVWVINPDFETVDVHRKNSPSERFNTEQELSGNPHLPGLCIPVAQIFHRRGQ